jgi:hypothetical protein
MMLSGTWNYGMLGMVDGIGILNPIVIVNRSLKCFSMASTMVWGGNDGMVDGAPTTKVAIYR